MSLKPLGGENKAEKLAEVLADIPPEMLDADLKSVGATGLEDDYNPKFPDPEEVVAQAQVGNTVHPPSFYKDKDAFAPSTEITEAPSRRKKSNTAKPATEMDLSKLDESMILDLPQIKAASFELNNFLTLKFKDKTLRGRWANSKNFIAGNLHRFLQLGYQVAAVEDIDETLTPVDPSMIDGTTIKYHDVVLLKIGVIRLMELYKGGIMKSLDRLSRAKEKGLAEANRQFASDVSSTPGATKAYNDYKAATGKEPVSFTLEQ